MRKWPLRKVVVVNVDSKGFCDIFGRTFLQLVFRSVLIVDLQLKDANVMFQEILDF